MVNLEARPGGLILDIILGIMAILLKYQFHQRDLVLQYQYI